MALKGVNDNYDNPLNRVSFRHGAWSQPEGGFPSYIREGRVINVNMVNWTVDVRTQFDNLFFGDIQVASPYMHPNRGEGIYIMPEINSKCLVCIPSDGPPPFVLCFIMPMEQKDTVDEDDTASAGTTDGATFAGGRSRAKPGDIFIKGRDGNFIVLHRGGVLEIGASPVAQRIYIPLHNIVTDISQYYEHHNTGGAINWGISSSSTDENPETEYKQTFRLFANDEKADVRLAIGKVRQPVPEPPGEEGNVSELAQGEIGTKENPVAFEFVIAPGGFNAGSGAPDKSAQKGTKLKLLFDRNGGGFLRAEGSVVVRVKDKLRIFVDDDYEVQAKGFVRVTSQKKLELRGKSGVDISAENGVVSINGGTKPAASVGSVVTIFVTAPVPISVGGVPGTILPGGILQGQVSSGNPTVLI